jgi:AcrR family transcriptional regulator
MIKSGRICKGDAQLSRHRLLETATHLFLEHGYANLSMEMLAREAHVSLRTIYHQFGSKAGLFGALIQYCSDQWLDHLSNDLPLREGLITFGNHFLYRITRPEILRIRAILIGEAPNFPDLATEFYEQGPKRTALHLSQFFLHHQQLGHIVSLNSAYFLAEHFISSLRGERYQRLQLGLELIPNQQEIACWVEEVTAFFLYGCLDVSVDQTR